MFRATVEETESTSPVEAEASGLEKSLHVERPAANYSTDSASRSTTSRRNQTEVSLRGRDPGRPLGPAESIERTYVHPHRGHPGINPSYSGGPTVNGPRVLMAIFAALSRSNRHRASHLARTSF